MREALDPWLFVYTAYAIGIGGTMLMISWSLLSMRRAERRRERSREL
jgi:nitrate reductase gamma subunit